MFGRSCREAYSLQRLLHHCVTILPLCYFSKIGTGCLPWTHRYEGPAKAGSCCRTFQPFLPSMPIAFYNLNYSHCSFNSNVWPPGEVHRGQSRSFCATFTAFCEITFVKDSNGSHKENCNTYAPFLLWFFQTFFSVSSHVFHMTTTTTAT